MSWVGVADVEALWGRGCGWGAKGYKVRVAGAGGDCSPMNWWRADGDVLLETLDTGKAGPWGWRGWRGGQRSKQGAAPHVLVRHIISTYATAGPGFQLINNQLLCCLLIKLTSVSNSITLFSSSQKCLSTSYGKLDRSLRIKCNTLLLPICQLLYMFCKIFG